MPDSLAQLWRSTVPGVMGNAIECDPASHSIFVADGWGIAYAALRLHRLDIRTGEHLADFRTRHQAVSGMILGGSYLYVATDARLFELRPADLSVVRQWERGLVRNTMHMLLAGSSVVMANWRSPTIGLLDLDSGRTRRVRVGLQPHLVRFGNVIRVIAGFDGGMWILDTERARMTDPSPTPPVTAIAAGAHLWGVVAGRAEGGQGQPPVWVKRGSNRLTRLTGDPWAAQLAGECSALISDDAQGVLWCVIKNGAELVELSQTSGKVVASFGAGAGARFAHVDAAARVALTMTHNTSTAATLVCYALP